MPFVILPTNSASGGYEVSNSLRFNSASSDRLTRTTGTPTSQQKFTWSSWCKRSNLGNYGIIQGLYSDANNYLLVSFLTADRIDIINYAGATTARKITTPLYRDVSAWYHIVVSVDTTLATATDRIKLYVNGTQVTAFNTDTAPSQNANLLTNATTTAIGVGEGGSIGYYNGYISEIYSIDGQALTPSSFGETDEDTGIWKPKAYTGTYGTNGFYLQFKNSASLGTDSSGNGNTFTVNNLTSVDQSTDTPTNNFCTMNPLRQPTSNQATFTNGNLTVATSSNTPAYYGGRSTMGMSSGKWYFESKLVSQSATTAAIGIQNTDSYTPELFNGGTGALAGYSSTGWSYFAGGVYVNNNADTSYGNTYTAGDIISVALDCDNAKLYFAKNGTWQNSGVPTSGATGTGAISITSGLTYLFAVDDGGSNQYCTWDCNFGSPPYSSGSYTDGAGYGNFSYAVPSGYYSLNTRNLANFG